MFKRVTEPSPAGTRASRGPGPGRPTEGRLRLLAAAEQLFATRGLGVPNREIVAAAGQHNRSAITYHFASRAGLIDAVRERHETPIARHRQHLIARLPRPEDRTTRQLVEAHIRPVAAEMLRCSPSYWARLSEMLLADQPLRFSRDIEPSADPRPRQHADTVLSELLELMVAHLRHLPEREAVGRVALTVRFLNSGLARWERDSQAGVEGLAPLAPFTLILSDLAVAMLDAPSSVPPQIDAHLGHPHLAGHQALPARVRSAASWVRFQQLFEFLPCVARCADSDTVQRGVQSSAWPGESSDRTDHPWKGP
jgi:AcrR family transcriptional regulator